MLDFTNEDGLQVKDHDANTPLRPLLAGSYTEASFTRKQCLTCVALIQRIVQIDDG